MKKEKWFCEYDPHDPDIPIRCKKKCKGHKVTKQVLLAAQAMAWYDGDWWLDDQVWRQNYLDNAGQFLTELDLRNG